MKINLSGKTVGRLQSTRLNYQRKYNRTLSVDETIQLLLEKET